MTRLARWLGLAATPTFALMALATGLQDAQASGMMCSVAAAPLSGMALMYLLMSGFHLGPWLRLAAGAPPTQSPCSSSRP
jgi:hypothetical protein